MQIIPKMPPRWMAGKQPKITKIQRAVSRSCWLLWASVEFGHGKGRREYTYCVVIYADEFALLRRGRNNSSDTWKDFYVTLGWNAEYNHMSISACEDATGDVWHKLGKVA